MILQKFNKNVVIGIVLIAVLIVVLHLGRPLIPEQFNSNAGISTHAILSGCDDRWGPVQLNVQDNGGPFPSGITKDAITEGFVPWNSAEVGKYQVSLVQLDQRSLEGLFSSLVEADRGKLDTNTLTEFRDQPHSQEQAKAYINHVLARINRKSDRMFHILDIQSTHKQSAIDSNTQQIVDKWTAELFIQEKDSRKVHAHAMNIRMEFLSQGTAVQIQKLHFITDYFYQRPLVDGDNIYDRNFRIKNPFSLTQPFFTSEDKILPSTNVSDSILTNIHKDLRKPEYRCFDGQGKDTKTKTEDLCNVSEGYWDTPVTNDSECPFFMANKQYPNRLGGVNPNGNRCEMPVGTKTIGYRFISNDPAHKPWCYNCHIGADGLPGSIGPCCEEQRNVELYPELGGNPDYAYPGDVLERGQNWQVLQERGLNWAQHPTNTHDITNPLQKQPVFNAFIGSGPGKM
jgi:hypothetical protein